LLLLNIFLLLMSKRPVSTSLKSPIQEIINDLYTRYRRLNTGSVATYIPELGKANPDWFGISVVTADGQVYEAGDTEQLFTIQSISKPLTYGIALEDNGRTAVTNKIWVEPTGEAFNSISLDPTSGRPLNPMINAGAIATTSLVEGKTTKQKMHRILDAFARYTGRRMEIDRSVYQSESETGHRNRAISYMLRNFEIIGEDPIPSLEAYFMQCSILVNCRDLGMMAATLANGGLNPATGSRAVVGDYVESMLSVMGSCGMYDAAGEWIYNVGMPAKSGVAGGILAVLPGQLGIGVFSPRLDKHGNSVRGIEVCRELSRRFDLHMFHVSRSGRSVIRHSGHGGQTCSNRLRQDKESELLKKHGHRIESLELQGELVFSTAEIVVRESIKEAEKADFFILNFRHVQLVDLVAAGLIKELAVEMVNAKKTLVFSGTRHLPMLGKVLKKEMKPKAFSRLQWIQDSDLALEYCENLLIQSYTQLHHSGQRVSLKDCQLVKGFKSEDIRLIQSLVKECHYKKGENVINFQDPALELYFLMKGKVSAWLDIPGSDGKRVATFTPGMVFGEMALLDSSARSARVTADTDLECMSLALSDLNTFAESRPRLMIQILRNLSELLAQRLRKANAEISALYQ
jgi:glutaminase